MTPHLCPVCQGRGFVPLGFYNFGNTAASLNNEPCIACCGKGVLWDDPNFNFTDRANMVPGP